MNAEFFKKSWNVIGEDITNLIFDFFKENVLPISINETLITHIPKELGSRRVEQFRPISLCNEIYKIISKYLPTDSRKFSPYVLVKNNLHFQGRQIVENIILAGECIKSLQSKARKDKWCALKLDMAKAFDSDEWHYIINILKALWFSDKWCRMIHWCLSSTPISVSINDRHFGSMKLSTGIRQGDPLSTFLFILPAEDLSRLIKKAEILGNIHGIQITRGAPRLTHLIFA